MEWIFQVWGKFKIVEICISELFICIVKKLKISLKNKNFDFKPKTKDFFEHFKILLGYCMQMYYMKKFWY